MLVSHMILGSVLIAFAIWLQRTEKSGWPDEERDNELDREYFSRRMNSRRKVNWLLGGCGVLILVAGFGTPRVFIFAWMTVTLTLFIIVILAGIDALRTHRHQTNKMLKIRRNILGDDAED